MHRTILFRALPAALLATCLAAATGTAGAIWSIATSSSGQGISGQINYQVFCQDGQIISGSSGSQPDSVQCNDGTNKLTWKWGRNADGDPWYDVRNSDNKSGAFRAHLKDSLEKVLGQGKLKLGGRVILDGAGMKAQCAVLKVPSVQLANPVPQTIDQLIALGVITPAHVLYRRDYVGPTDQAVSDAFPDPGLPMDSLSIFHYADTSVAVPGPGVSPAVLVALSLLLGGAGLVATARRRMRAAG